MSERNVIMEKKVYNSPQIEVEKINLSAAVLVGSPEDTPMPDPSHPGAPKRPYVEVF